MKKIFFLTIASSMLLLACNTGDKSTKKQVNELSPIDSLMHKVMEGHDNGMAKMGPLMTNKKQIDLKVDSLIKMDSAKNSVKILQLKSTNLIIDSALNEMNQWMETFDMDMEKKDSLEKINYLLKNEKDVNNVFEQMKQAKVYSDSVLAH